MEKNYQLLYQNEHSAVYKSENGILFELFEGMIGKVFTVVYATDDEMVFENDSEGFRFFHHQDCCEVVDIEDICGELVDLMNTPILQAECVISKEFPAKSDYSESHTWSFYKFATIKGSVTVRWYGSSNGYYSETVSFERIVKEQFIN